jgi:hypothetical protein
MWAPRTRAVNHYDAMRAAAAVCTENSIRAYSADVSDPN